jgi:dihydroorotate dehydrogenase (NAD+) catalytic subunit
MHDKLSASFMGKMLKNPVLLGSGTLVEHYEQIQPYFDAGIGGVVPRTTRKLMKRKTHPIPHLYENGSKHQPVMLNAEWTGADIEYWRSHIDMMAESEKISMSISGRDIDDCVEVCKELDKYKGWLYHEINVSCAHSNAQHGMITRDKKHIYELISRLKDAGVSQPIALKLGYSEAILELCHIAKEAGVDAIVAVNTYGPVFDFYIDNSGVPQSVVGVAGAQGGLSGAPIFQIALTAVANIKTQVDIDVIGCGGVTSGQDVIKMIMAGASLVQVYSAAHVRGVHAPKYFKKLISDIETEVKRYNYPGLHSIKGAALGLLKQPTEMELKIPTVDKASCIGCDICISVCLPVAIYKIDEMDKKSMVDIDGQKCVGCGHCLHVCPTQPNSLSL